MRIAVLTNAYPPNAQGGAGQVASIQVELLRARGHEVRVWVGSYEWTKLPLWKRLFVHVADFSKIHPYAKEIFYWKPDVLVTHNLTGLGFRTPHVIQHSGIRWVHLLHDVQLFEPRGLLDDEQPVTFLQRMVSRARRRSFGRPDVICSPTEWLLKAHQRRGWFRSVVTKIIPNPAPMRSESISSEWHTPLRCLYVGRVSEDKGASLLQNLMKFQGLRCEWKIIGSIDKAFQTPFASFSNVTLLGQQSPTAVRKGMEEADVLFVPSQIEENQPTVILEALACGLPIIASSKGGIPETLGDVGSCLPVADISAWSSSVELLTEKNREHLGFQSQERWKRYDPDVVVVALEEVLTSNKKI